MQIATNTCRKPDCANPIPASLTLEQLCLGHFLDDAFERTNVALKLSGAQRPLDSKLMEHLLLDGLTVVENLEAGADDSDQFQRDRMLELLFVMANVHEILAGNRLQPAPRFS